ncbi:MAG: Thioredoxin reductase, partial [uncultured Arthrobacter sp.]
GSGVLGPALRRAPSGVEREPESPPRHHGLRAASRARARCRLRRGRRRAVAGPQRVAGDRRRHLRGGPRPGPRAGPARGRCGGRPRRLGARRPDRGAAGTRRLRSGLGTVHAAAGTGTLGAVRRPRCRGGAGRHAAHCRAPPLGPADGGASAPDARAVLHRGGPHPPARRRLGHHRLRGASACSRGRGGPRCAGPGHGAAGPPAGNQPGTGAALCGPGV